MSLKKTVECEIAIIGAGPYGLSAAAHLKGKGIDVQVFGRPMEFWADKMPAGMLLRSPRVASNISDPSGDARLNDYEDSASLAPRAPLPLETFVEYGRWFQKKMAPGLDRREAASINRNGNGFNIELEDGEVVHARKTVVAAGIGPFQRIPNEFSELPPAQVSHCYQGCDVQSFSGKRVAVIGAGQSALESAALLQEAGAEVELIAKIAKLRWIGAHPWLHRLGPVSSMLYSPHDIGPAGISRLVAAPNLVKKIPLHLRDKIRKRAVRPAGSQWLPGRLKKVTLTLGRFVKSAKSQGSDVKLALDDDTQRSVDYVLLGTGYSVDISRYGFLAPELVGQLELLDGYPRLGAGFSSSVAGLHFVGATAARSFGPLLYFVAGTDFASQELASYIARHRANGV
jgi:thioredoxin reductase